MVVGCVLLPVHSTIWQRCKAKRWHAAMPHAARCVPLCRATAQVLSMIVKTSQVEKTEAMRMDENLTAFEDCLGTCERILKTPIPLSYTRREPGRARGYGACWGRTCSSGTGPARNGLAGGTKASSRQLKSTAICSSCRNRWQLQCPIAGGHQLQTCVAAAAQAHISIHDDLAHAAALLPVDIVRLDYRPILHPHRLPAAWCVG
jgi:hypothetical protein